MHTHTPPPLRQHHPLRLASDLDLGALKSFVLRWARLPRSALPCRGQGLRQCQVLRSRRGAVAG